VVLKEGLLTFSKSVSNLKRLFFVVAFGSVVPRFTYTAWNSEQLNFAI
jgi:hypothetical protein